ncbi:hypothetical protein BKA80DRAFT_117028 [Phyllosticta citrichinensis]
MAPVDQMGWCKPARPPDDLSTHDSTRAIWLAGWLEQRRLSPSSSSSSSSQGRRPRPRATRSRGRLLGSTAWRFSAAAVVVAFVSHLLRRLLSFSFSRCFSFFPHSSPRVISFSFHHKLFWRRVRVRWRSGVWARCSMELFWKVGVCRRRWWKPATGCCVWLLSGRLLQFLFDLSSGVGREAVETNRSIWSARTLSHPIMPSTSASPRRP